MLDRLDRYGDVYDRRWGHETKANAEKGIEAVKTHAPGAKVEDLTDANPVSALAVHCRVAYSRC
ncbi:MAG: YegP family protein [Mycobacterium sp.]|nr:YegP family protein [Mycobacterium sp.]